MSQFAPIDRAEADATPTIRAAGIDKWFGDTRAVADASLEVGSGELVALLGPSGSGKTTLLRVVAGFEVPDSGSVEIDGRLVAGPGTWVEPERRRVGMVFQDGALFPHLDVAHNVGFGEPAAGRVDECLELVGLADRARSYPHELSGGERQRVALARALAIDPTVVLLDEPFAALDAGLRIALREEVAAILREAEASALLVTHDQQEALSLADRVAIMNGGRIEQTDTPEEVYTHPVNRWVAGFLGAAEILPGTAHQGVVDCELGHLPADPSLRGAVVVVLRPEAVAMTRAGERGGDDLAATVLDRAYHGHDQLVRLRLDSGRMIRSRTLGNERWNEGDRVGVRVVGDVCVLADDGSDAPADHPEAQPTE